MSTYTNADGEKVSVFGCSDLQCPYKKSPNQQGTNGGCCCCPRCHGAGRMIFGEDVEDCADCLGTGVKGQ